MTCKMMLLLVVSYLLSPLIADDPPGVFQELVQARTKFDSKGLSSLFQSVPDKMKDALRCSSPKEFLALTIDKLARNEDSEDLYHAFNICRFSQFDKSVSISDIPPVRWNQASSANIRRIYEIFLNFQDYRCNDIILNEALKLNEDNDRQIIAGLRQHLCHPPTHPKCPEQHCQLNMNKLALFIGDGHISSGVDEEHNKLEGGRTHHNACYLSSLLKRLCENPTDGINTLFSQDELERIADIYENVYTLNIEIECVEAKEMAIPIYEFVLLNHLKKLQPGHDILLATGFSSHAMLIKFTNIDGQYTVNVFNSGSGLNYHGKAVVQHGIKYASYKCFVNVPLSALRRTGFLRRLSELLGVQSRINLPDRASVQHKDARDFYADLLSVLIAYEVPVEAGEESLITPQRSGTCSVRCFFTHLKFYFKGRFRLLKLEFLRLIIEDAFEKNLHKSTTGARILKFGFENYARSLLKFIKNDSASIAHSYPNLHQPEYFGNDDFWYKYQTLSLSQNTSARAFSVDFNDFVGSDELEGVEKQREGKVGSWKYLNRFQYVTGPASEETFERRKVLAADLTADNFDSKLEIMADWRYDEQFTTVVLDQFVHRFPVPRPRGDVYETLLGLGLEAVQANRMKSLYNLFSKLMEKRRLYSLKYYIVLAKLHLVFQYSIVRACPGLSSFRPIPENFMSKLFKIDIDDEADWDLWQQAKELGLLLDAGTQYVDDIFSLPSLELYFKQLVAIVAIDEVNPEVVLMGQRKSEMVPASFYYWRDFVFILRHLVSKENLFDRKPLFFYKHDPLTSCRLSANTFAFYSNSNCIVKMLQWDSSKSRASSHSLCSSIPASLTFQPFRNQAFTFFDDFTRKSWADLGLMKSEWSILLNTLYKRKSFLDVYHHLLYDDLNSMSWTSVLHLGIKALAYDDRSLSVDLVLLRDIQRFIENGKDDLVAVLQCIEELTAKRSTGINLIL